MVVGTIIDKLVIHVPVKLVSSANLREHYRVRAARVKEERMMVAEAFSDEKAQQFASAWHGANGVQFTIHMIRVAPRPIKDTFENLPIAFKGIKDEIAKQLGIDDGDEAAAQWSCGQSKGAYGLDISIIAGSKE